MLSVVVFNKETDEVLACIPLMESEDGFTRSDIDFIVYDSVEPVFVEEPGIITIKKNTFITKI